MGTNMIRIKNWSVFLEEAKYPATETHSYKIQGRVYGDSRLYDGAFTYSSEIVKITDKGTHKEVITDDGSVYELRKEDVDPEYEKQFPNCYDRLRCF